MSAKPRRLLFVALMLNILALLGAIYAGTREPAQSISIIILVIICLLISIALISTFLRRDHPESTAPTDHKSIVILPNTPIDFTGINGETVRVEMGDQGYEVEFESIPFNPDDAILQNDTEGGYMVIKPIIHLAAKRVDNNTPVYTFNPPLSFRVIYTAENIGENVRYVDITVLINDHNSHLWKLYPTTVSYPEKDKRMITLTIDQWTSHSCYGGR